MNDKTFKSTTIIGIRKDKSVVIAGDGQASLGNTIIKTSVKKVRRLGSDNSVIAGFAGSTADAAATVLLTLLLKPPLWLLLGLLELLLELLV